MERYKGLVVITLSMFLIFLFQSCTKTPAGPPWIDNDHNLDFVWTYPGDLTYISQFEVYAKGVVEGDTFAFADMTEDTTYRLVVLKDGPYQLKVRAQGINGMVGPFSEESDTVWSITLPPEKPGKPFWKP